MEGPVKTKIEIAKQKKDQAKEGYEAFLKKAGEWVEGGRKFLEERDADFDFDSFVHADLSEISDDARGDLEQVAWDILKAAVGKESKTPEEVKEWGESLVDSLDGFYYSYPDLDEIDPEIVLTKDDMEIIERVRSVYARVYLVLVGDDEVYKSIIETSQERLQKEAAENLAGWSERFLIKEDGLFATFGNKVFEELDFDSFLAMHSSEDDTRQAALSILQATLAAGPYKTLLSNSVNQTRLNQDFVSISEEVKEWGRALSEEVFKDGVHNHSVLSEKAREKIEHLRSVFAKVYLVLVGGDDQDEVYNTLSNPKPVDSEPVDAKPAEKSVEVVENLKDFDFSSYGWEGYTSENLYDVFGRIDEMGEEESEKIFGTLYSWYAACRQNLVGRNGSFLEDASRIERYVGFEKNSSNLPNQPGFKEHFNDFRSLTKDSDGNLLLNYAEHYSAADRGDEEIKQEDIPGPVAFPYTSEEEINYFIAYYLLDRLKKYRTEHFVAALDDDRSDDETKEKARDLFASLQQSEVQAHLDRHDESRGRFSQTLRTIETLWNNKKFRLWKSGASLTTTLALLTLTGVGVAAGGGWVVGGFAAAKAAVSAFNMVGLPFSVRAFRAKAAEKKLLKSFENLPEDAGLEEFSELKKRFEETAFAYEYPHLIGLEDSPDGSESSTAAVYQEVLDGYLQAFYDKVASSQEADDPTEDADDKDNQEDNQPPEEDVENKEPATQEEIERNIETLNVFKEDFEDFVGGFNDQVAVDEFVFSEGLDSIPETYVVDKGADENETFLGKEDLATWFFEHAPSRFGVEGESFNVEDLDMENLDEWRRLFAESLQDFSVGDDEDVVAYFDAVTSFVDQVHTFFKHEIGEIDQEEEEQADVEVATEVDAEAIKEVFSSLLEKEQEARKSLYDRTKNDKRAMWVFGTVGSLIPFSKWADDALSFLFSSAGEEDAVDGLRGRLFGGGSSPAAESFENNQSGGNRGLSGSAAFGGAEVGQGGFKGVPYDFSSGGVEAVQGVAETARSTTDLSSDSALLREGVDKETIQSGENLWKNVFNKVWDDGADAEKVAFLQKIESMGDAGKAKLAWFGISSGDLDVLRSGDVIRIDRINEFIASPEYGGIRIDDAFTSLEGKLSSAGWENVSRGNIREFLQGVDGLPQEQQNELLEHLGLGDLADGKNLDVTQVTVQELKNLNPDAWKDYFDVYSADGVDGLKEKVLEDFSVESSPDVDEPGAPDSKSPLEDLVEKVNSGEDVASAVAGQEDEIFSVFSEIDPSRRSDVFKAWRSTAEVVTHHDSFVGKEDVLVQMAVGNGIEGLAGDVLENWLQKKDGTYPLLENAIIYAHTGEDGIKRVLVEIPQSVLSANEKVQFHGLPGSRIGEYIISGISGEHDIDLAGDADETLEDIARMSDEERSDLIEERVKEALNLATAEYVDKGQLKTCKDALAHYLSDKPSDFISELFKDGYYLEYEDGRLKVLKDRRFLRGALFPWNQEILVIDPSSGKYPDGVEKLDSDLKRILKSGAK